MFFKRYRKGKVKYPRIVLFKNGAFVVEKKEGKYVDRYNPGFTWEKNSPVFDYCFHETAEEAIETLRKVDYRIDKVIHADGTPSI